MIFEKKKILFTSWIRTREFLNASQLLTICAVVFDEMLLKFSSLLCLQLAAECKLITTITHVDKTFKIEG